MNPFKFWFSLCDLRCWCGNPVKIITDPVVDLVEDTVDVIEEAVDLVENVVKNTIDNTGQIFEGIAHGDWTDFRDGTIGNTMTSVYVAAIFVGVTTGNAWLISAGVVALDGQHNDGELTHETVNAVGNLETNIFDSEVINRNAEYIELAIIVAGTMYASAEGFTYLAELAGMTSYINTFNVVMGANQTYESYQAYEYYKTYFNEMMKKYEKWVSEQRVKDRLLREQWFNLYANVNNSIFLYEAMPGGSIFNAGAGSNGYSPSSIHEQSSLILGFDDKKDTELDKMIFDNLSIDYVKLNN